MEHDIYKPYKIELLFQRLSHKLSEIERDAINAPSVIDARTKALETVQSYEPKNPDGAPLPPEIIRMTQEEAKRLGYTGTTVKVADLIKLTSMEMAQPADYARQCCAAYLLEQGIRWVDDNDVSFQMARAAYEILANPAAQNDDVKQGKALLEDLELYRQSDSAAILLAESEYEILKAAQFNKMNGAFSPAEQIMRSRINSCVANSFTSEVQRRCSYKKYNAVFDPEKMRKIENIMTMDSTSSGLLRYKRDHDIPVILFEYTEPLKSGDRAFLGFFAKNRKDNSEYLMLFTNNSNDAGLALIYTHEMRHAWQDNKVLLFNNVRTLLDGMIFELLREGDAHAIMGKVRWTLSKKFDVLNGNPKVTKHHQAFTNTYEDPSLRDLSLPERMKRATQAVFLCFLEQELSETFYIHKFIDHVSQRFGALDFNLEALQEHRFLKPDFLLSLSQVNKDVPYLNEKGCHRIRDMFVENLPAAIARCKNTQPSGPAPSP